MNIRYIRPGRTLSLYCGCHSYFGSGSGSVRLALLGGAIRGPENASINNGFLAWSSCDVTLPSGASARVSESYYPGGDRITMYVADLAQWRSQRRAQDSRILHRPGESHWCGCRRQPICRLDGSRG